MHDVVIRNGLVVDGSNTPGKRVDIAIDGDTITEVGAVGRGHREIDADGQLVTPGFVDMHTHYDAQVTWDPYLTRVAGMGVLRSSWAAVESALLRLRLTDMIG